MRFLLRLSLFSCLLSFGVAFAEDLPNPFFPPDPWKDNLTSPVKLSDQEDLPNPFFPPDPWKDNRK